MKAITCGFLLLFSTFLMAQELGLASYYADSFQGISTASGEAYDKVKMTCAHNDHPFGTMLKVTRLDNNKSVTVRVNDRGPFIKGRIVDLSRAAAEQLDLVRAGVAQVKVEVAGSSSSVASRPSDAVRKGSSSSASTSKPKATTSTTRPSTYVDKSIPKDKPVPRAVSTSSKPVATTTTASTTAKSGSNTRVTKSYNKYGLYQIQLMTPKTRGYGVQIASFASYDNVMNKVAELQGKWFDEILVKSEPGSKGQPVYKVILGNFESQASANNYKKNLKSKHRLSGFVVNLDD